MQYQAETIQIIPFSGSQCDILTAQSVSIQQIFQRNTNTRLGRFRPFAYRGMNTAPNIQVSVEYIPTGQLIEGVLGLKGTTSVIDNIIPGGVGQSYTVKIGAKDMYNNDQSRQTIYIEQGVLTQYSFSAQVSQQPKIQIQIEGQDMYYDTQQVVVQPIFNDQMTIPRACDIDFNFPTGVFGIGSTVPQAIQIQIPLQRNVAYKIGSPKPYQRGLVQPVIANVTLQAYVETHKNVSFFNQSELQNLLKGTWLNENIDVTIYKPQNPDDVKVSLINFRIAKPYIESITVQNQVGSYRQVQLELQVPISFETGDDLSNIKIY